MHKSQKKDTKSQKKDTNRAGADPRPRKTARSAPPRAGAAETVAPDGRLAAAEKENAELRAIIDRPLRAVEKAADAAIERRRAQETIAQLKDQLNFARRLPRELFFQRDALEKENAELRRRLGELMKFAPAEAPTEAETEA